MADTLQVHVQTAVDQLRHRYELMPAWQQHVLWAFLLVIMVVTSVVLMVQPAQNWYQVQFRRWQLAQEDRNWLANQQPSAALLEQYRQQGKSSGTPLLSLATTSAKAQSLNISRYEPRDDNDLEIWMDQVPYVTVMTWLRQLQTQDASVRIRELSLRAGDDPGIISVTLELTR